MSEEKLIYLDNAATTRIHPQVLEAMLPYFQEYYGNPSSIYDFGNQVKGALEEARKSVAGALGADPKEIYFTSGATEADNWAVFGAARKMAAKGKHIITSTIEHHAVLHPFEMLEKEGFEVTYVPVDEEGILDLAALKNAVREDTTFISVMAVNNEIGTIQPIREIVDFVKGKGILVHTDAVQLIGKQPVNVKEMGVDLLSLSAHKMHGPKGVGALYIRKGVLIDSLFHGGGQERKKRPGTENVAGIVGLAKALEVTLSDHQEKEARIMRLREHLIDEVMAKVPHVRLNGSREKRIAGNANFSFRFIEGESLLLALDMYGICASSGSACTSGSLDPSHVLLGIGLPHEIAHGSLRISISEYTTQEEIDELIRVLPGIMERLREMSPLYEDYIRSEGAR